MRKNWKIALTTTAVLTALGAGSTLYAQSKPDTPHSGSNMMQGSQGDMSGMMNMMGQMGQMGQMMEGCNTMMKTMNQQRGPETPNDQKKPAQQG